MELSRLDHESPHRPCPIHGQPTRAALCEDGAGVSLVWECRACSGYWAESLFLLRIWASLPLLRRPQPARWRCPSCASPRCCPICHYECLCGQHECHECGQVFFITRHLTRPPTLDPEEVRRLADQRWQEFGFGGVPGNLLEREPLTYVPITAPITIQLECLSCHPGGYDERRSDHELVWAPAAPNELDRYAWRCRGCGGTQGLARLEGRPFSFYIATTPDIRCPACHQPDLDQSADLIALTCRTCGARFTLSSELESTAHGK